MKNAGEDFAFQLLGGHFFGGFDRYGYVFESVHHFNDRFEFVSTAICCRAVVEYFDDGEAFVLDGFDDEFVYLVGVEGCASCYECCSGSDGEFGDVEGGVGVAVGGGGCFGACWGAGGELPAGHAVDVVVHDDVGHVDVASTGVDEVVAADGGAVAVAADEDDVHFRFGHFYAGGKGGGSSVGGVQGAAVHVAGYSGCAADAGYDGGVVFFKMEGVHGADEPFHDDAVAAAGAPDVREFAGTDVLFVVEGHGYLTSLILFSIWSGLMGSPSTRKIPWTGALPSAQR